MPFSYHLFCISLDGLPLYSNRSNGLPAIPFPVIGSINGVHMYAENNGINLLSTCTENAKVIWKEYHSVKLIFVLYDEALSHDTMTEMLDNLFKCLVMTIGLPEFKSPKNIEKFKKKLRLCTPLITTYMLKTSIISNITHCVDMCLFLEHSTLTSQFDLFVEECGCELGVLMIHGKVVVATDKYWQLNVLDSIYIIFFALSLEKGMSSCDTPVYLPQGSPNVPHRLVCLKLIDQIKIVVICGVSPSLTDLHNSLPKYWSPMYSLLKRCLNSHPRGFPPEIKFDDSVLGFVLINSEVQKCWSSFYPHGSMTGADQNLLRHMKNRYKVLLDFYEKSCNSINNHINVVERKESYECGSGYKCYAIWGSNYNLYVLFSCDIPTFALGNAARDVLKRLLKEKFL